MSYRLLSSTPVLLLLAFACGGESSSVDASAGDENGAGGTSAPGDGDGDGVGTGGSDTTGGATSTGGDDGGGGTDPIGGSPSAGGADAVGGGDTSGGSDGAGGDGVGGTPAAGGAPQTGGAPGVGGNPVIGGAGGAGGADPVDSCTDGELTLGEEGIDCGFSACALPCLSTPTCDAASECVGDLCTDGMCAQSLGGVFLANQFGIDAGTEPFSLTEDLQIGGDLVIAPGAIIYGNGNSIRVTGDVLAAGTSDAPIILVDVVMDVGAGPAHPESPANVTYQYVHAYGGALWTSGGDGSYVDNFVLEDSRITAADYLYIWYPESDVSIARNVFFQTGGLSIGLKGASQALVTNNLFEGVTTNSGGASASILLWVSYETSGLDASKNSFIDPPDYAVALDSGNATNFIAEDNYWGTTDADEIATLVYDQNDDVDLGGLIDVMPFLTEADPLTPGIDL